MPDFDSYIASLYRQMELEVIRSMQRNLALHQAEEEDAGLTFPQWQAMKLKELRRYQRQNQRMMEDYTLHIPDDVAQHLKEELREGSLHELRRYREALGKGYRPAKKLKDGFFRVNDRKVNALIQSLTGDLSKANHAALRMANDAYRQVIFTTGMFVANGVYTEQKALDAAMKLFTARGLNCIEYKDGRRVNIADYASMAVRTANQRAYMMGEGEFRKSIGETLVLISKHGTACELCQPFEHTVLIDDVYSGGKDTDGDYMLLSAAMYMGLYHPRCRHGMGTFYPELEEINHYLDDGADVYQGKAQEAHTDNQIQKYTRMAAGATDPEQAAEYQRQQKIWEAKKAQELLQKIQKSGILNKQTPPRRLSQVSPVYVREKIASGEYGTRYGLQQYRKHEEGTKEFAEKLRRRLQDGGTPQGALTISHKEAQKLVLLYAGTGIVDLDRKGIPKKSERVNFHTPIGKYWRDGRYYETTKGTIHYGKKGAHIVPIGGKDFD